MRTVMLVLAILVVPLTGIPADIQAAPAAPAAPTQACRIVEGSALGAVRLGMPVEEAFALVGKPVGYVLRSPESVYLLPGEAIQITAVDEKVTRLASRDPLCITGKGVKIGDSEGRVTEAYAQSVGSIRAETGSIVRLVYLFDGISFVITEGRVSLIEIFQAERSPSPARSTPAPGPSPTVVEARSGTVEIVSLSGRVEGTTFIVSGTVTKIGPPLALFAEVTLFGEGGRTLKTEPTAIYPNPVGGGHPSNFEERISIEDIVRRVGVTVRLMNPPNSVVAQTLTDIRNLSQFSGLAERKLEVMVLGATPDRASGTQAAVTNRSSLRILGLVIEVQMETSCRNQVLLPDGSTTFRTFIDRRQGTLRVDNLPPNARVEVPIELAGLGPCAGFGAEWRVTWKPVSLKVDSEE